MSWWPLNALLGGARQIQNARSNQPNISDLESILAEFIEWKAWYEKNANEARVRATKLELIDDKDASWERRKVNDAVESAARCDVGIRVMTWAIKEIREKEQ